MLRALSLAFGNAMNRWGFATAALMLATWQMARWYCPTPTSPHPAPRAEIPTWSITALYVPPGVMTMHASAADEAGGALREAAGRIVGAVGLAPLAP
jgi:hypothetical protein